MIPRDKHGIIRLTAIICFLPCSSQPLLAQEGTWTASGFAGIGFLNFTDVNQILDQTVNNWNQYENIPIGPLGHFTNSLFWSLKASYRYERDLSIALSFYRFERTLNASYVDAESSLRLERTVESTDVMVGFTYHFPGFQRVEPNAFVELGEMFARADAYTYSTKSNKVNGQPVPYVYDDTQATYQKSKLIINAGVGIDIPFLDQFVFHAQTLYKLANVGQMEGNITGLQRSSQELSTSDFNFSALIVTLGLGFRF